MAGPMRWVLFFGVIVMAAAGVAALWMGFTEGLIKAIVSCALIAVAAIALYALRPRS
ncbi:MAG: hypothetical protein ACKVS5_00720 [Parvularculaceae bacterium]